MLLRGGIFFFFSSRRRHTRCGRDWSSDVCSSDLPEVLRDLLRKKKILGIKKPSNPTIIRLSVLNLMSVMSKSKRNSDKMRSEERRVGKECRYRWSTDH